MGSRCCHTYHEGEEAQPGPGLELAASNVRGFGAAAEDPLGLVHLIVQRQPEEEEGGNN